MKMLYRLGGVIGAAGLLLAICLITITAQAAPATPTNPTLDSEAMPFVGFVADGGALNAPGQTGEAPSLIVKPNSNELWVALVQNNQVIVSKFVSATHSWVQQGGALNFNGANQATQPSLDFGGANHQTPWVTWREKIAGTDRILAARFDGQQWTFTGASVNGAPSLNAPSDKFIYNPVLAVGATSTGTAPLPWIAWGQGDGFSGHLEIRRAMSDATALGGISWQPLAAPTSPDIGYRPDLVFSGPDNHLPWLAWSTFNDTGLTQVFVARAISDTASTGGWRWEKINRQANCQQATPAENCALNPAEHFANGIRIASGTLLGETQPTPWVAFAQLSDNGGQEIHVMRLDIGTPTDPNDDRFIPVGSAVNSECLQPDGLTAHNGAQPDLYFVGNVPHIAWVEQIKGIDQLLVCHLADARPGQERWDLDTITPVNHHFNTSAAYPRLGSNGTTPYVAWQEGENPSQIFVAHRTPDGPAWGRNYPPFIRTISWSRNLVGQVFSTAGIERALAPMGSTRPFTLTTSCDHVNGWEQIKEIHFKIANTKLTAFSGKYVAASNQVFIEDPEQPGSFLGGFQPGAGQPIETSNVTFYIDQMRIRPHGAGSAALDIDWVMSFKDTLLLQDVKQMIKIVYADGQSTGFFETGLLSFDYRMYLPMVAR